MSENYYKILEVGKNFGKWFDLSTKMSENRPKKYINIIFFQIEMYFYLTKIIFKLIVKLDTLISISFPEFLNSEYFSDIVVKFHHGDFLTFLCTVNSPTFFTPVTSILKSWKRFPTFLRVAVRLSLFDWPRFRIEGNYVCSSLFGWPGFKIKRK